MKSAGVLAPVSYPRGTGASERAKGKVGWPPMAGVWLCAVTPGTPLECIPLAPLLGPAASALPHVLAGGPSFNKKDWRNELSDWIACCCCSVVPSGRCCKASGTSCLCKHFLGVSLLGNQTWSLRSQPEMSFDPAAWVYQVFPPESLSPAGPAHCHIPCHPLTCTGTLLCLGLFWPAFPRSPSWRSRNVPEPQTLLRGPNTMWVYPGSPAP